MLNLEGLYMGHRTREVGSGSWASASIDEQQRQCVLQQWQQLTRSAPGMASEGGVRDVCLELYGSAPHRTWQVVRRWKCLNCGPLACQLDLRTTACNTSGVACASADWSRYGGT